MTSKSIISFAGFERSARGLLVKFSIVGKGGLLDGVEIGVVTSGFPFPSYGAALKAARRAVDTFKRTGKFPNMCAHF